MNLKMGLIVSVVMLSGCASAVDRHHMVQAQLDRQINCANAHSDIKMLKAEKASTSEKIANGIASILPTSIIFNLIAGEFSSRKAIASGEFDQMLYMKIDDIEKHCGSAIASSNLVLNDDMAISK
ncbi:hypothetical protein [Aliiglaciecola sp. M165]|uniref:hypothetical protein n=1 Tax=Aliiglaciecola sp. M165 TaxID=2593649 RepID=UPI00117E5FE3|nr:hypothetical protein [Aliiglaciecola sp. M165]TRY29898.1 hypothetical protein FM019_17180 [Aliiglaciecola sp. M165]